MNFDNLSRVLLISWMSTIALGPVYWLPFVHGSFIGIVKIAIIFFGISSAILLLFEGELRKRVISSMNVPNKIFALICFFMISGFWVSVSGNRFSFKGNDFNMMAYSFILAYMMLLSSIMLAEKRSEYYKLLLYPSIVIVILSSIHVAVALFDLSIEYEEAGKIFKRTAFGSIRTGWSSGLALFVITIPAYVAATRKSPKAVLFSFLYGSLPILVSQNLTGGRAGFLASLFAIMVFGVYILPKKYFLFISMVFFLMFLSPFSMSTRLVDTITALTQPKNSFQYGSNIISVQHRLDQYVFALQRMYEFPLFGSGIGNGRYVTTINSYEIHNVFLKAGVELGVPYMLALLAFPLYLVICVIRNFSLKCKMFFSQHPLLASAYRTEVIYTVSSGVTIMSGIIISCLEPRYIYGGLGISWSWWVASAFIIFNGQKLYPLVSQIGVQKP